MSVRIRLHEGERGGLAANSRGFYPAHPTRGKRAGNGASASPARGTVGGGGDGSQVRRSMLPLAAVHDPALIDEIKSE
ncbi:hypothetical protein HQ394_09015 [Defluviicoccus vanus]|uniref:Uncharacterized protein n=1 Tax=Defluviicoccus vanus TaxID=111831 RepID=A0A7H1N152_9PROT|nr:hypothetical protein HQ394_09015 [Defluviicoccus vanus]